MVAIFSIFCNFCKTFSLAQLLKLIVLLLQARFLTAVMTCLGTLRRLCHPGPVIALSIVFICFTVSLVDSMIWLCPPSRSLLGKLNVCLLVLWLVLILGNFFRAVFIGPGYVPKKWKPNKAGDGQYLQFCQICQGYKPPRAHHCRVCQRCVLKMDHHCPWINNCCGHSNHTNFTLFVLFAPVGCFHATIIYIATVWYQLFRRGDYLRSTVRPVEFSLHAFLINLFATGLSLGTTIAVGLLFYYQIKSIVRNCTGIEQWIVEKAESRRIDSDERFVYPYDLGTRNNILQVINLSCKPVGDGYVWNVADGCHQYSLTIEQLRQKMSKRERMVEYRAVSAYSGWWLPCSKGIRTCLMVPCTDEPRIPLAIDDVIVVSRGTKYWLYGDKVLPDKEVAFGRRVRGWFPRNCALRSGIPSLNQHRTIYASHKQKIL